MRVMPTPSTDDGPGFHSDMPISELTERDTRAIKASVVSSAPLVAETEDGVTHETWLTPTKTHWAQGLESPDPKSGDQGSKAGPWRARGRLVSKQEPGEKMQMRPCDLISTFSFDLSL